MKNYIDVKTTLWNRFHFFDDTNMETVAAIVHVHGISQAIESGLGFATADPQLHTQAIIHPKQNDGEATIEIFAEGKEIWNNKKSEIVHGSLPVPQRVYY